MANSSFTHWVVPGGLNGGNASMVDAIDADTLPWAMTPELVFSRTVTWKDLRDATDVAQADDLVVGGTIVAGDHEITFTNARTGAVIETLTHPVHEDTVTIGGTASDGNYDTIFTSLTPPVRVRTVRSTTPATNDNIATQHAADITDRIATDLAGIVASASANSNVVTIVYEDGIAPQTLTCVESTATGTITASVGADEDDVAAGLEALIEAARATTLVDYVADETVTTDTVTIQYVAGTQVLLSVDFPGTSTGTVATTTTATIPIGTTGNLFPANVWVAGDRGAGANVTTAFAGITTLSASLGDSVASDGLMTTADLTVVGFTSTIAATEYAEHMEVAYVPIATIVSDELFANLTAGSVDFLIPYSAPPTI